MMKRTPGYIRQVTTWKSVPFSTSGGKRRKRRIKYRIKYTRRTVRILVETAPPVEL